MEFDHFVLFLSVCYERERVSIFCRHEGLFTKNPCVVGHFSMAHFLILVETKRSEWIMSSGKCHTTF